MDLKSSLAIHTLRYEKYNKFNDDLLEVKYLEYYKKLRLFVGNEPLILPGSVVIIVNEKGEILLQHRHDGGWGLPGGLMELGESLIDTAIREVYEETGLSIKELELIDIFSGPKYFCKIKNGDEIYSVTALYTTKNFSGNLVLESSESKDLRYFDINSIPKEISKVYRDCIDAYKNKFL
jgi:8-oxo-dGTP pyrophosphatase MutT (NUDIX family)